MNPDVTLTAEQVRRVVDVVRSVDPEDSDLLTSMIEGETDFEAVLWNLCEAHDSAKSHVTALNERISAMRERKERLNRQVDAARAGVQILLEAAGVKRWMLAEWTPHLTEREVIQAAPDADPALLPDDLVRIKREPEKSAIKAAIAAGRNVPGYLTERICSATIRRK